MRVNERNKIPNNTLHIIYKNLRGGMSERIYTHNYIPFPKMKMLVLGVRDLWVGEDKGDLVGTSEELNSRINSHFLGEKIVSKEHLDYVSNLNVDDLINEYNSKKSTSQPSWIGLENILGKQQMYENFHWFIKEFHSPPTIREIIVELEKLLQRSGDNHHIFLEGFDIDESGKTLTPCLGS